MWWSLDLINIKEKRRMGIVRPTNLKGGWGRLECDPEEEGVSPRLWSRTTPRWRKYETLLFDFVRLFLLGVPAHLGERAPGNRPAAAFFVHFFFSFYLLFLIVGSSSFHSHLLFYFYSPFPIENDASLGFIERQKEKNEELAIFSLDAATKTHTHNQKWEENSKKTPKGN